MDASYNVRRTDRFEEKSRAIRERMKIDWPDVPLPDGWADVMTVFNLSGYGITVIDAKGIVRGIDVPKRRLEPLLEECGAFSTDPGSGSEN